MTAQRVIVTGGASGIGAAISLRLLDAGAHVAVIHYDEASLKQALFASGLVGRVVGIAADLSDAFECRRAIREAAAALGGLDVLVNTAAITGPPAHSSIGDLDDAFIDRLVDTNLKGPVRCSAEAARLMAEAGAGGVIVTISSVLAHTVAPRAALYAATKLGLLSFTKHLAAEFGSSGIRAVAVSPGDISTPGSIAPEPDGAARFVREPALGRRGEVVDIAHAVEFLVSDRASYITGVDLVVDGGFLSV